VNPNTDYEGNEPGDGFDEPATSYPAYSSYQSTTATADAAGYTMSSMPPPPLPSGQEWQGFDSSWDASAAFTMAPSTPLPDMSTPGPSAGPSFLPQKRNGPERFDPATHQMTEKQFANWAAKERHRAKKEGREPDERAVIPAGPARKRGRKSTIDPDNPKNAKQFDNWARQERKNAEKEGRDPDPRAVKKKEWNKVDLDSGTASADARYRERRRATAANTDAHPEARSRGKGGRPKQGASSSAAAPDPAAEPHSEYGTVGPHDDYTSGYSTSAAWPSYQSAPSPQNPWEVHATTVAMGAMTIAADAPTINPQDLQPGYSQGSVFQYQTNRSPSPGPSR
jgi:hypothetical protein